MKKRLKAKQQLQKPHNDLAQFVNLGSERDSLLNTMDTNGFSREIANLVSEIDSVLTTEDIISYKANGLGVLGPIKNEASSFGGLIGAGEGLSNRPDWISK